MNQPSTRIKSKRKRRLRIIAALLALCVSVTSCPNMPGAIFARAAESSSEGVRSGDTADNGQSTYMKYANNEDGKGFTRDLNVFNVQGIDNGEVIQTTFLNQGYRTVSKAGAATVSWNAPRNVAMGNSLFGSRDIALVHNGRYARIRYTVENKGSTVQDFQIGSSADVMIGNNDCAPVVGTASGLKMEGAPRNSYTYNLVAPTVDTLWYGHFGAAPKNIFNDLPDKTVPYDGDSGMAWSWSGTIAPGQKWSRYVLLGVGELPPAPKKPTLTVTKPTLTVGKTGNVTGTADPGCTVCVEVAGEEFSAVADKNGRFSVPVTLSENAPGGEMPLNCYAVSPQGGLSDTVTVIATVAKEPSITLIDTETVILADTETNDAWYKGFIKTSSGSVSYTKTVNSAEAGTYTVVYTAKAAGFSDKTAKLKVIVLSKPLELSVATATRVSGKDSFNLSAKLMETGGVDITETGFVWGIMKNPTTAMNNGQKKTSTPVKTKNGSVKVTAEGIVDGMDYYARAYAKNAAGEVWYGEQVRFSINGKQYGSFTIKNNGDYSFTVTRTGGTDGLQRVYYRTVNGSAVGGIHFQSESTYLTFGVGETSKKIWITEKGVNAAFSGKPATAYTNADRVYWLELYRVTGGGQLGSTVKAKRTMTKSSGYKVDRSVYNEKSRTVSTSNDNCIVADRSKTKAHQPFFTNNRGYNQTHGQKNFNTQRSLDVGTDKERSYLKQTAGGYYYRLKFTGKEDNDAYEHIWIANHQPNNFDSANEHNGPININDSLFGAAKYTARWDIDNKKEATITVPGAASRTNLSGFSTSVRDGAVSGDWLQFGVNEETNVWFSATGKDTDKWRVNSYTDWLKVKDEIEPQLLSVGPIGNGTYKPGEAVTLPLVFDEIVDSQNSSLSGVTLDTTWGTFKYAGGADTNVLYFTGTVPQGASGTLKVTKINGADKIKDMCGANGKASGGTGSTSVKVDNKKPAVSITSPSLTNGTAQATLTATNADSVCYAWTQSASMPVTGWITARSGAKVTNRQTSGTWYLHALATYDATGATAYDSRSFNFSSSTSGELPELNVSVDNSTWVRERKINITTRKPANAAVTVRTPSGSVQTVTGTSYTATANGGYTFTLTAGEEKVVKSVTVAKIDRMAPVAQVTEPVEKNQTENVTFTVTPVDAGGSGVKNVTGKWTKTTNGGSSVTENAVLTKQSDGTYKAVTPASNGNTYTYRLNLTVTDHAGNTATAASGTCTINLKVPTVTVTKTGSTSKGDTYTYTVSANGNTITAVNLPNGGNTTALSGSFTLTAPGTYYVTVSDQAGHVVTSAPMTVAEGVDGDAPEVRAFQRDTNWAKTTKMELSIYEESSIKEIKLQGGGATKTLSLTDGSLKKEAGSSSAYRYTDIGITANGTYTITVTDANGNQGTAQITVKNIDRTAPVLTAKANATPKASGWYTDSTVPVVMTFSDPVPANNEGGSEMSGIASVQYKLVSKTEKDKGTEPSGLKSVPAAEIEKGTYSTSLTQMGIWYLYVKVTDVAGNEYKGYCHMTETTDTFEIKKDQSKGSLVSLTGPATAQKETEGLAMTVTVNYGPSGAEMTATGQTAPIGTLLPHDGPSTKKGSATYTTKQIGVNRYYIEPVSWGSKYYWTYYVRRVTFDSQGGSEVPSMLVWTKQNSTSGGTTVDCKVEKPEDPTRKGYTFGGWYTDAAYKNKFDFDNQTQVRTDITLYAKWTQDVYTVEYDLKMPEYIIHFSHNTANTDCTNKSNAKAHRHYQCEKSYTAPEGKTEYRYGDKMKLPVPVLETVRGSFEYEENGEKKTETHAYSMTGFTFDGWYDNPEYTGRKYTEIEADATGNKRYYARWLDTEAPVFGSEWRYGSSYNDWYSTHLIGRAITDNADIDLDSIEGQVDGRDWVKPARIDKPDYHYGSSYVPWFGEGSEHTNLSEGRHTYRIRLRDKAGNVTVSPEYVIYNDRKNPKGDMTCSVEPTECYRDKDGIIYDEKGTGRTKIQFFKEVPTYRVSAEDIPADNGLYSGLYRVSYILTDRDMATGTTKPSTEEPKYTNPQTKNVYFSGYGKGLLNGTVTFTLPENWRGDVTSIYVRDRVNNSSFIPAIGEVVVDTLAPTIRDEKISFINDAGEDIAEIQDKWYSQQELANMGALYFGAHVGAEGNELLGAPIRSVSWLINGKNTGKGQTNTKWEYTDMGASTVSISDLTGVNDITVEAVDFAGNKTTVTKTLKIKGGKERTPEAARDYPADAVSQLSKNADYAITVDGKTYIVNSGETGRIPFVLTHDVTSGVAAGKEVDLCGKTITIVKKGITENGEECSKDSDSQTLVITERPAALSEDGIHFEAELLQDAEDAKITLAITDDQYAYEYSADKGKTWREVPEDHIVENLPKGNILLRAKAKANTVRIVDNVYEETNDGWPHGRQRVQAIAAGTGKVKAEYDLNDGGTHTASGKPQSETVSYKSSLTKPETDPVREGYEFMGWYTREKPYQVGSDANSPWRFKDEENANAVGEILGMDRDSYSERIEDGVIGVTLYAGWRETTAPKLSVALETDTSTNGSGVWKDVTGKDQFYPNLRVKLTYSDNVGVTKLYYKPSKKTSGSYSEVYMGGAKEDGTGSSGDTQFTLPYTNLSEGSRTYTFKVVDAAGNETEQEITYKLDKTLPVLGEASFTSGHKNIWHWIIRKSDLKIAIPVTESGSGINQVEYTLTPFTSATVEKELTEEVSDDSLDTGKAVTQNADFSNNTATITLPNDFKGAITVVAVDQAGNRSEVKKIGVEVPGVKGLFVENNAPTIDVKADDAVLSENYYDTAPKLSIHVEDKKNGTEKNAGIASVTWKIDRTPRGGTKQTGVTNKVKADFDAAPTRDYTFTLNELAGKTGVFDVTIIATDQAGNRTTKTVKVKVKSKAETPDFTIDYVHEKLTGLVPDAEYDVRGEKVTADESGCISIAEEWFGTNFQISRRAYLDELLDSDYAEAVITARPDAPDVSVAKDETIRGKNDAQIDGVTANMEYSADGGKTWAEVQADDLEDLTEGKGKLNVPAGLIQVRIKANDDTPHGCEAEVTPKEGRILTVTFNPMGGSNVSSITDQSWHDTVEKPDDPSKAGHDFVGWYKDAKGTQQWHFEKDVEAADKLTDDIILYAKWRDNEKPALGAVLKTGSDGSSATEDADSKQWYPNLSIDLTYTDNIEVTKLYVSKDDGDYVLVGSMDGADGSADISDSTPQGKTADGYVQYHFMYDDIAEGSHTYTFKAEDADGNSMTTEALTAKLDTTRPVLGEISFDSEHKTLWSWIVRNDILLVTVPITETGSGVEEVAFTLIPADDRTGADDDTDAAVMTGTAKAEKVSGGSADYQAVIAVASDFKGTIRIETKDKVGNKAAAKTIGTTGEGIKGVIVENNAPMITVHADRDITGAAALSDTSGISLSEDYYETAPELTVNVTDEENDTLTGLITGGIASLSYKIGEGEQTEVRSQDEYKTAIRTTDSFIIPADKIPEGVTDITITATDHAGNVSKKELTIKVKTPLPKPEAKIGYVEETLSGLAKNAFYLICVEGEDDDRRMTTDADGKIKLEENWIGKTLSIVQTSSEDERNDSPAQSITIPARPAAPELNTEDESHPLWRDGKITGLTAGKAYEISEDGGNIWKWRDAVLTGTEITGLSGTGSVTGDAPGTIGTYHVRTKALDLADGTGNFAGVAAVVTVNSGPIEKYETPEAGIDYKEATLTGLVANAEYKLEYEKDGEVVTEICTADEDGNILILEEWMGNDCQVIRSGYGLPGADSDAQRLMIPSRPETPVPVGKEVSVNGREDGKIIGLTAGAVYEISTDGGETWTEKTADDNGEITGLGAGEYIVRVPATDTSLSSLPSEVVKVHGHHADAVPEKAATCTENGNKAHYSCSCGKLFMDSDCTQVVTEKDVVTDALGHDYSGEYQHDEEHHWKVCSRCGEIQTKEKHVFDNDTDKDCNVCGYERTVTGVVSKDVEKDESVPDTKLSTGVEELADAILTQEEKVEIEKGTDIKFILNVKDAKDTVSSDDKAVVQEVLNGSSIVKGFVVGQYLDIRLFKIVGETRSAISETKEKITIAMDVPENLKSSDSSKPRIFAVIRVHDGVAEVLSDLDDDDDTITIATDRFSAYAIVYKEAGAEPTPTATPTATPTVTPTATPTVAPTATPGAGEDNKPTPAPTATQGAGKEKPSDKEERKIQLHSGLKATQTGNKLQISWGRVKGADGYSLYVQYCNKDFTAKSLNQVKSGKKTKITVKKVNGKKLDTTKNFKMYIVAWKWKNGKKSTLAKTLTVHIAGKDSVKYTNVKTIKVKKTSYTMKKGDAVTLRPKAVLYNKRKKQLSAKHTKEFRYISSNKKIATVTAGGKIKARGTGSCTIYVFAKNGCKRKIKIKIVK